VRNDECGPDHGVVGRRRQAITSNRAETIGATSNYTNTFGYGNYNAGTAKLEKRYSAGLTGTAAYTWGHVLTNVGTTLYGSIDGLGSPDPRNLALQYSDANWDIRHSFVASFNYDIPFGKGRKFGSNWSPAARMIVGNWQANAILSLRTGVRFGLTADGVNYIGKIRPKVLPGKDPNAAPPGGRTPDEWFDTSNVVAPASITNGNLGNMTNTGPPRANPGCVAV
jgi:hypothetical protein